MVRSKSKDDYEVRWHGRGGQGVVTASHLLASAALREGLYFRSLPEFGAERSGAPILVYTRISVNTIFEQGPVTTPDTVAILDSTLIGRVNMLDGLKKHGMVLINTPMQPQEIRESLDWWSGIVCCVDATGISLRHLKRNIPNVAILGALSSLQELVSKDSLSTAIKEDMATRFKEEIVAANMQAFESGCSEAVIDKA